MPTVNPRVNVTLEPQQYELLSRLARAQRRSRSAILRELLELVIPVLGRVVVAVEGAQRAQEMARTGLRESVERAEAAILPHVQAAMGQLDLLVDQLTQGAPSRPADTPPSAPGEARVAARRRGRKRPNGQRDPRPVTRGSGTGVATPHKRGQVPDLAREIARRIEAGPVERTETRSGGHSRGGRR